MNIIDHLTNFNGINVYIGNSIRRIKKIHEQTVANDEVGTKNSIYKFDGCVCMCYLLKKNKIRAGFKSNIH